MKTSITVNNLLAMTQPLYSREIPFDIIEFLAKPHHSKSRGSTVAIGDLPLPYFIRVLAQQIKKETV